MVDFSKKQTFIFIGRSGSGKGTQAGLLQKYIQKHDSTTPLVYLETGHLFRDFIQEDSCASRLSHVIYKENKRQPDFLAVWMWSHIMIEQFKGNEHVVIDGTPRSLPEAKILDTALAFFLRDNVHIIHPRISREEAEKRLKSRGRIDDETDDAIKRRLDWFEADVEPAIDYYRTHKKHQYIEVDGEQTPEQIHQDIVETLE